MRNWLRGTFAGRPPCADRPAMLWPDATRLNWAFFLENPHVAGTRQAALARPSDATAARRRVRLPPPAKATDQTGRPPRTRTSAGAPRLDPLLGLPRQAGGVLQVSCETAGSEPVLTAVAWSGRALRRSV
jgi:hypothetical protein